MAKYIFETTPERSKLMSKIRGKDTQPEIIFRKALWAAGMRYRINVSKLPGKPDIVFRKHKLVVFIDGDFCMATTGKRKSSVSSQMLIIGLKK